MKWIAFSLLGLFAAFLALCSPIVPGNAGAVNVILSTVTTIATRPAPRVLELPRSAQAQPAAEPDVVRNSVFTQELADQCADTAHYDCQLVKTAPEVQDVPPPIVAAPASIEPPRQDKFNCTGCLRR